MGGHMYTDEERKFFVEFIPGHTYKEIQAEFTQVFGWEISISQIKGYMANHKINNGLTGQFKKGHVSHNKGKKGICSPGCEKSWFQNGHMPVNHRSVGSERVNVYGYVEVKAKEPRTWKLKHKVLWEEHFGPVPKGKIVIFLNGDKADIRIENLEMINQSANARLNQNGMRYSDPETTKAAIGLAELMAATGKAKRRKKGES